MLAEEMPLLEKAWNVLKDRVPAPHRQLVAGEGLFVEDDGEMTIRCYDERACVFVVHQDGIARCSIQRAFENGEFPWIKPLSCHLFPIRVKGKQRDQLRFERFSECDPALDHGKQLDLPLVDFLEEPLIRAFGEATYRVLKERSDAHKNGGA